MRIRIISLCSVASLLFLTAWIDITESLFTNSVPKQRYIKRIIRIPVRSYRINTSRKTNIVSANIANIDSTIGPQRNIQFNPSVGRSLPKYRKVTLLSNNILQRLREAQKKANPKTGGNKVPIHHHTVVLAKNANILSNIGKQQNGPAINTAPATTKGGNQPGSQPNNPGQGVPNKPSQGPSNSVQNFVQGIKMGSGNTYQVNTDTGNTKVNSKIHKTNVSNNINNIHITNNYTSPSNAPSQGHSRQPYPQVQLPVGQSNLPYQPTGQRPNQGGHNPRPLPSGQQHPTGPKPTPGTKIYLNIVNNLPVKNNASNNNHRAKFSPSSVGMNPNFSTGFHGANNGHSNQASQNPGPLTLGAGSSTGAKPSMRQPGGNPASPGQGGALPSGRNRHGPGGQQRMGNQPGGSPLMSGTLPRSMMPSGLGSLLFGGPPQSRNRGPSNQPGNTQYPFNGQLFRNAPSQINAAPGPGPQQPGGAHINQLGGKVPGSQPGAGHWQQPGGGQGHQPGGGQWQQPGGGHAQQPGGGQGQQPGGGQWQQPGGGHGQQPGGQQGQQHGGGHGQQPGGGHGQQPGGGQWQQPGGGHGQQPGGGHGQQPGGGQGQHPGGGQLQQPGGGHGQQPGGGHGQQPGGGQGQQPGGGQWQQPGGGHGQQPVGGHGQQPGAGHGQQPSYNPAYPISGQGQQAGGGHGQQPGGGHGQQPI
ncbi:Hypothetical predicted protein [Mytilus galloprovincialis]|uniref:Uncharacterized protein n=1 Tax=Mytilus galloprovincialis TaxID=29158 RepID=A0A8B6GFN8_MYTGA|nr:Hypothetical predicted protein [Mytilus galloprovincialis]